MDILISGFGGQGLMSLGKMLAKAAIKIKKHASWFPSYGAEVRGGIAHCFVKISKSPIGSPLIEQPDIAIFLNQPSFDKYGEKIRKGGLAILNSDVISHESLRNDIKRIRAPLNKIAWECGNIKTANTVALGILLCSKPEVIDKKAVIEVLKETFHNQDVLNQNLQAFYQGLTFEP